MKKSNLVVILSVVLILALGLFVWQRQSSGEITQEEAIRQAKEYQPVGNCTDAETPAVHTATGAKHTFSSGCIAPGWVAEQ